MEHIVLVAEERYDRLDAFVAQNCDLTRSHVQKLIEQGKVKLNGAVANKSSQTVLENSTIEVTLPDNVPLDIPPQDIPLDIVYQDDCLAVINKQQGLTVHPANGVFTDTLVNALLYRLDNLSGINGVLRPGIVHRLDKDTSGLLVVAKNDASHNNLATQIQTKTCRRIYLAVVEGVVKQDSGSVEQPIARSHTDRKKMAIDPNGKYALTYYTVLERYTNNTLVMFELKTGRTHQIRVHCKYLSHPVVGDTVYGYRNQKFKLNGQLLHAWKLMLTHPKTQQPMTFVAPLPQYFVDVINTLRKGGYQIVNNYQID